MKLVVPTTILVSMIAGSTTAFTSLISSRAVLRNGIARSFLATAATTSYSTGAAFAKSNTNNRNTFLTKKKLTTMSASKEDATTPFPTWTFDEPCRTMELTSVSSASITVADAVGDDSDLIILGIYGPKKEEKEDDEDEDKKEDDEDEVPEPTLVGKAKELDEELGGALTEAMIENYKAFKNGANAGGSTPTLRVVSSGSKTKRVILLGLGNEGADIEEGFFSKIGSTLASKCDGNKKVLSCSLVLPSSFSTESSSMSDLSSEFYSTLYSDNRYRTGSKVTHKAKDLASVSIVFEGEESVDTDAVSKSLASGKALASGVFMSKDIVNAPHNVLNSESMANLGRQIAEESGGTITCVVLGKEECEKRGMGSFLGVARGSETEPQFIHLTYKPKSGNASKKLGIVGKGLLFDTGGYNIKVAMMELMKFDCGGAAATFGAARAIGELAPEDVEVHFIVAACENMINDRAVVPSDILTASNGKTIEIINTDAEGRLTLADALVYADKEVGCDSIIEMSTLTGACMVSLGKSVCGVWTADDDLAKELDSASTVSGDKSWRMPLVKEYNDQLKSKIADITNCGTRYGGAITAALFLQHFVSSKKPFAHIDIAGPVWNDSTGATGFGAKLATEWVTAKSKKE